MKKKPNTCILCGHEGTGCNETVKDGVGNEWICTKYAGHDGEHAACSLFAHPRYKWPGNLKMKEQAK